MTKWTKHKNREKIKKYNKKLRLNKNYRNRKSWAVITMRMKDSRRTMEMKWRRKFGTTMWIWMMHFMATRTKRERGELEPVDSSLRVGIWLLLARARALI